MSMIASEIEWFDVNVMIRRVADGEVRIYKMPSPKPFSDFIWCDGNFACDCNRHDFFEYASGRSYDEVDPDEAGPCSDGRYIIDWIKDAATGEVLYTEGHKSA
jgi:hypothetical protein